MVIYRIWYLTRYLLLVECPRPAKTLLGRRQAPILSLTKGNASSRTHAVGAFRLRPPPNYFISTEESSVDSDGLRQLRCAFGEAECAKLAIANPDLFPQFVKTWVVQFRKHRAPLPRAGQAPMFLNWSLITPAWAMFMSNIQP